MSAGAVPSNEYLIETVVLGANAASVTFNNLSQYAGVYKHLQLITSVRSSFNSTYGNFGLRFNGDSGSNYFGHRLLGTGSSVFSQYLGTRNYMYIAESTGAQNTENSFMSAVLDILDPFSSSKNTTVRSLTGHTSGSSHGIGILSGAWNNTSAISSLTILEAENANWVSGSRFSLYGVTA
jgi:hypothetical protein